MLKKMASVLLCAITLVMLACGPSCTLNVARSNTYYTVTIKDSTGLNTMNFITPSNSNRQITFSHDCSSVVSVVENQS